MLNIPRPLTPPGLLTLSIPPTPPTPIQPHTPLHPLAEFCVQFWSLFHGYDRLVLSNSIRQTIKHHVHLDPIFWLGLINNVSDIDSESAYFILDDSKNMHYLDPTAQTFIVEGLSYLEKVLKDVVEGTVQVEVLRIVLEHLDQFISLAKLLTTETDVSNDKRLETLMRWRKEELQEYEIMKTLLHNLEQQVHTVQPGMCNHLSPNTHLQWSYLLSIL